MADTMTQYPRNFHKLEFLYHRVGKFGVFRGGLFLVGKKNLRQEKRGDCLALGTRIHMPFTP